MLPKWAGLFVMVGAAMGWPLEMWWHTTLTATIGFLWFYPNEYLVHRFAFHGLVNKRLGRVTSRQHILHHEDPGELDVLFNDPRISVTFGIVYFLLAWALAGLPAAAAFSTGNFVGLVHYEYVHLTSHRPGVRPWMPWLRPLKRSHLLHHYKNEQYWFGVTSQVFDKALGSWRNAHEVESSETVRSLVPPAPKEHEAWLDESIRPPGRRS